MKGMKTIAISLCAAMVMAGCNNMGKGAAIGAGGGAGLGAIVGAIAGNTAIGAVIGHEMTHGFDDQGCKYDEKGNLNNWWTEEDAAKFKERTQQLVKLFNEFELRGNHINGELTLGENIADLGGLNISWDAYQMTDEAKANQSIDGFTPAQRFFISYGTIWRNNIRDKALERRIKEDVHSPAEARVNRTLGSMPHFYEAFVITPENKMYIAPEERAAIW